MVDSHEIWWHVKHLLALHVDILENLLLMRLNTIQLSDQREKAYNLGTFSKKNCKRTLKFAIFLFCFDLCLLLHVQCNAIYNHKYGLLLHALQTLQHCPE